MSYPGGKSGAGVYQTLINLMPPHAVYVEPFLGGGAVMRHKRPAALNIGVDLDPDALQEGMRPGRARAPESAILPAESPDRAVSAEPASRGDARSRAAKRAMPDPIYQSVEGDGISFLESYSFFGLELVYCDPPYLMETRSGRRLYKHEMNSIDHRRLLRVVMDLPCMVMISGYWSEIYGSTLAGWNTETFQSMTRGGRQATEWVWFNFPRPTKLHDTRYLGGGFRERERIKRKKKRWTERLRRMPELERQALLAAIAETAACVDAVPEYSRAARDDGVLQRGF